MSEVQRRETCDTHHSMKILELPHVFLTTDVIGDTALVVVWVDIPGPQSRDLLIGFDVDQNQKLKSTGRVVCGGAVRAAALVHVQDRFGALTRSAEVILGFGGRGHV